MAAFEPIFESVLRAEGGYILTQDPDDLGGMTFAGISRRWWGNWEGWRIIDRMKKPRATQELKDEVRDFYRTEFWDRIRGDEIKSEGVARMIYSSAVLSGLVRMFRMMRAALDIEGHDHKMSDGMLAALNDLEYNDKVKTAAEFATLFALERIRRYTLIVRDKPSQVKYLRGWISRALNDAGEK